MNQTLEITLLGLIVPALALAVILFLERVRKVAPEAALQPVEGLLVTPAKIKILPKRKR